jgi:hypothetical protein
LKDRATVLRLIYLLLSSDELSVAKIVSSSGGSAAFDLHGGLGGLPLLEAMVRALARDPDSLAPVERLIEDLNRTEEGRALLPEGLEEIWGPVRAARLELGE